VAHRVAEHGGAGTGTNRGGIERDNRRRIGANRVLGDVHHRKAGGGGKFHRILGGALKVIHGPIFDQAPNRTRSQERGRFERHADFFGNFDDGLDIVLVRARGTIRANLHPRLNDFAGERFGVRIGARTGAWQADIHRVNSERFHQVKDFNFLGDTWVVDRRILQPVAKRLVIHHHAATRGNFGAGECVPVVNEFAFHFFLRETLIAQRVAVRRLGAIWFVDRLAKFAAVHFRLFAH